MGSEKDGDRYTLPGNIRPRHYDLQLEPDFDTLIIRGSVRIEVEILKDTTSITLNAVDIKVLDAGLTSGDTAQTAKSHNEGKQELKFEFEKKLLRNAKAILSLNFEAVLSDKGVGFYKSSYVNDSGEKKYMACTQMEPVDARRVFPCFDEPAMKATFSVAVVAHENSTCLSNMNVLSEEKRGSKKLVTFDQTPPMSTYLVAVVIGDLEYIESTSFRIPIRVYTTPGRSAEGSFALELAAKTLKFYEEVFDSPFPLPKMDMVAVHDSFGAMENWGLVIYESTTLLLDEKTSGVDAKRRVSTVVQHELAHQWFGNLVTMDFWDGLWLNEGFATWMSWYSTDSFFPEWNIWQNFVTDDLQKALGLDCLRSSHPVEVPVQDANEINQVFDAISYSKGSCVIRMLAKYLDEEIFLKGIQAYLRKHAYGNTKTSDLWDSMTAVSGKDVATEMSIWTRKVGYPILTVQEFEAKKTIIVRQDRFLKSKDLATEENKTIYPVSLGLINGTDTADRPDILLNLREIEIQLNDMSFFKLNSKHAGFYRTLYLPERLVKIGEAMKTGLLPVEDRIGVIADASALASSGYQKTSALLGMLRNLKDEKDTFVWKQIRSCLVNIEEAFKFEDHRIQLGLENFKRGLMAPEAKLLGWDFEATDDMSFAKHKAEMFESASRAGDTSTIEASLKMFTAFTNGDGTAIHPNIRNAVYAMALKHQGKEAYKTLLGFLRQTRNPDEAQHALIGLGNTRDPNCIQELLDIMLTDEIKTQDFYLPMMTLRKDAIGAEALWKWTQTHWEEIQAKLYTSLGIFGFIVGIMIRGLTSKKHLGEIQEFFKGKDTSKYGKQLALVLEDIQANIAWAERDGEDIRQWLQDHSFY